jgi:hypothetical protein
LKYVPFYRKTFEKNLAKKDSLKSPKREKQDLK